MTPRKPDGYIFFQEITRAVNANRLARTMMRRIVDETPGPQAMAVMIAKAANALGENLDALQELERLARAKKATTN